MESLTRGTVEWLKHIQTCVKYKLDTVYIDHHWNRLLNIVENCASRQLTRIAIVLTDIKPIENSALLRKAQDSGMFEELTLKIERDTSNKYIGPPPEILSGVLKQFYIDEN